MLLLGVRVPSLVRRRGHKVVGTRRCGAASETTHGVGDASGQPEAGYVSVFPTLMLGIFFSDASNILFINIVQYA